MRTIDAQVEATRPSEAQQGRRAQLASVDTSCGAFSNSEKFVVHPGTARRNGNFASSCRLLFTFALLLIGGCDLRAITGDKAKDVVQHGDFAIQISSGTSPSFKWPGANATSITVQSFSGVTAGARTMWQIYADDATALSSPERYGSFPARTHCFLRDPCPAVRPLSRGTRYVVFISRLDGQMGLAEFTP